MISLIKLVIFDYKNLKIPAGMELFLEIFLPEKDSVRRNQEMETRKADSI